MTLCEKCIHGEICAERDCYDEDDERALTYCADYINKADFAEVCRCKDCKSSCDPTAVSRHDLYCNNYDVRFCERDNKIVCSTHFCSYGERKDKR